MAAVKALAHDCQTPPRARGFSKLRGRGPTNAAHACRGRGAGGGVGAAAEGGRRPSKAGWQVGSVCTRKLKRCGVFMHGSPRARRFHLSEGSLSTSMHLHGRGHRVGHRDGDQGGVDVVRRRVVRKGPGMWMVARAHGAHQAHSQGHHPRYRRRTAGEPIWADNFRALGDGVSAGV